MAQDTSPTDATAHPVGPADDLPGPVDAVKPRLRGWIHAINFPLVVVAGILLTVSAPPTAPRVACLVFAITAALLFGTSAVYHLGNWRLSVKAALRRADHANIFLIIAGSYTPLAVLMLDTRAAAILLAIVWSGAALGITARMIWLGAPRWIYTPVYIALGWVAVGYMPTFWRLGYSDVVWLVALGGLAYTVGAVMYATKRPNPVPRWFGFHELFHAGTVVGFWCHFAAVVVALNTL